VRPGPAGGAKPPDEDLPAEGVAEAHAGDHRDQRRETYVELLAGDGPALVDRLRWHAAERQPVIGLRWGVAVQWTGETAGPDVSTEEALARATGGVGPLIIAQLTKRAEEEKFGPPPGDGEEPASRVLFLGSDNLKNLLADARRAALDRIVLINLSPQVVGRQPKLEVKLVVRLVDVAVGRSTWASPELTRSRMMAAVRAGGNPAAAMTAEVMKEIDARHVLEPMPEMTSEHAQRQAAALAEGFSQDPDAMLPVLVELRYYQLEGLLSADAAGALYDRILGPRKGWKLAEGDEEERRDVLTEWIESK
jgi:hypothetical protein